MPGKGEFSDDTGHKHYILYLIFLEINEMNLAKEVMYCHLLFNVVNFEFGKI